MANLKCVGYNPSQTPISGTEQVGDLVIGTTDQQYYSQPGGIRFWATPDLDLGYVIAHVNQNGNQPNPLGIDDVYIGFWRSEFLTTESFITLAQNVSNWQSTPQIFANGDDAKTWLNDNGYWTSYDGDPVTSDLILYYDPSNSSSYPGTGTTINDLSGNNLNGNMSGITFTSPYFSYNGSSSQVRVADNALLEPGSGSWTTEAWFYSNSFASSAVVLGKFNNGGTSQNVSYSIRVNTSGSLFAQYSNGVFATFVNSTPYTISLNTWYQVVYVWTNSGGIKTLETFINGSSIGTVNHTFNSILNSTNPLYLGSYNGGEYSQWLNGRIGITRIYNAALTSAQVLQNFESDKSKYGL
jgi:hypothetical protein